MEMQAQEMYDSISNLKLSSDKSKEKRIEELLEFDTKLTKIDFSMINRSFSRKPKPSSLANLYMQNGLNMVYEYKKIENKEKKSFGGF